MNPPTWAMSATPPPVRGGAERPEARFGLFKIHSPRRFQAGIRTRKIGKFHVRIRDPG